MFKNLKKKKKKRNKISKKKNCPVPFRHQIIARFHLHLLDLHESVELGCVSCTLVSAWASAGVQYVCWMNE